MFHLWFCLILLDVKINLYRCQCQCQKVCCECVKCSEKRVASLVLTIQKVDLTGPFLVYAKKLQTNSDYVFCCFIELAKRFSFIKFGLPSLIEHYEVQNPLFRTPR